MTDRERLIDAKAAALGAWQVKLNDQRRRERLETARQLMPCFLLKLGIGDTRFVAQQALAAADILLEEIDREVTP